MTLFRLYNLIIEWEDYAIIPSAKNFTERG